MSDCIEFLIADPSLVPRLRADQRIFAWGPAAPVRYYWSDFLIFRTAALPDFLLYALPHALRERVISSTILTFEWGDLLDYWRYSVPEQTAAPDPEKVLSALLSPQPYWAVFYGVDCDDYGIKGAASVEEVVDRFVQHLRHSGNGFIAWRIPQPPDESAASDRGPGTLPAQS